MYYKENKIDSEAYQNHPVFEKIEHMKKFYNGLADTCYRFVPNGTMGITNYESYVYMSISNKLDSIKLLLKVGHITDAFVLIRNLFDTVLVEIYIDVVRKEKFDWIENRIVEDVDEWLKGKYRIPRILEILKVLKESLSTKDLYHFFGWNTYLKKNRELLDDSVHANRYSSILLNCKDLNIKREKQLDNAIIILNQITMVHISFILHLNWHYLIANDYFDHLDVGDTPPEGSRHWIAKYAQEAFDEFIKPNEKLAKFIKKHCELEIS